MKADTLVIDDVVIPAGTSKTVDIQVARLLSGTLIHMPVHVFRSENPGPTLLLSGGLHGDEVNGIEVVRRMISLGILNQITCGSVVAIPIINVYGFLFFSREVPDGKDVNRSFPGSPNGSLAAQVAHTLATKILPVVDMGIDFHTGGASRTNYPQIRYDDQDRQAIEMAKAFQAPIALGSGLISGSLRACGQSQGVPIIVYEGGESLRLEEKAVKEAIRGTKRLMHAIGMLEKSPKPRGLRGRAKGDSKQIRHIAGNTWVRAEASGLFSSERESGQSVREGELIGRIRNPYDSYSVKVYSPMDGFIIGHNNIPLVHRGDALFHIGRESAWPAPQGES
ncbi:MAG TPA: succinylglutamate desuccinylase [Cryomorphaceae bacterium]|nr:succinylglutamate desuccinylase [Cryomorphaceae bacterium]